MKFDEFMGLVQDRGRMANMDEAVRAARCTLEVLSERLYGGAPDNLAAQLPREVGFYLREAARQEPHPQRFNLNEFFKRVSEKEGVDLPKAIHHARSVVSVLEEAVTSGEIEKIRSQLSEDFDLLFESGAEGGLTQQAMQ